MLYLAYGSNLLPQRLATRVPSARLVTTAPLAGWSLRFHKKGQDGSAKCDLVPSTTETAFGAVYRVNPAHRVRLDRAEDLGQGYELARLHIRGLGPVFCYRAIAARIETDLHPFDWYRELVRAGAAYHRFPTAYIRAIEAVSTVPDPDPARNRKHRALLHRSGRGRSRHG